MVASFYRRKSVSNLKALLIRFGQFSIGTLVIALLNLILIPVTTYFLAPAEYGKTSMFLLMQTLLIYVIYLGFDQAFTREFHDSEKKYTLLKQSMLIPLQFSIFLIIIMVTSAPIISKWLFADSKYTLAIYLLAVSCFLLVFERFILLFLRMENKALSFSIYSIMIKLTVFLGTIIALLIGLPVFITVVYGMLIGQILGDILLIGIHYKLICKGELRRDAKLQKKLARFALPIVIGTILYSMLVVVDKIFLRYWVDFHELGIYVAAFKVASILMIFQLSFTNFWIPTAYEWYRESMPMIYFERVSHIVMFIGSILFLLMLLFKNWVVVLVSPAYAEAQYIFPILCLYPLMMTVSETTCLGIVFLKKSSFNIYVSLTAVSIAFTLNILLIPKYGAAGAATATGTAFIVFFFARSLFSKFLWESFSIRRHTFVIAMLYLLALYSVFLHFEWIEKSMISVVFFSILFLYRKDIKLMWQLKNRKNRKGA